MTLDSWVAGSGEVVVDAGRALTHLPDTATTLVFRTTADGTSDLTVIGPRTGASYHAGKDVPFCVRVRVRPGRARPLLGVPVSEIVDRAVPIGRLWGAEGDRLVRDLVPLGPDARRVAGRIEAALAARLDAGTPGDLRRSDLLHTAAEAVAHRREPLPAIARRLAVSERHLRDLFTDGIGLPPKRFARIDRVRRVIAAAHPVPHPAAKPRAARPALRREPRRLGSAGRRGGLLRPVAHDGGLPLDDGRLPRRLRRRAPATRPALLRTRTAPIPARGSGPFRA